MAQVLDCQQAEAPGKKSISDIFYSMTPFQFLSTFALADDGSFDLNTIKNLQVFKWACEAANCLVRETGVSNVDSARIQVVSHFNFSNLEVDLVNYKNKDIIPLLRYGFPIECEPFESTPVVYKNHKGAQEFPEQLREYIQSQLTNKTLIGPFDHNPFGNLARFSPLNTVPKKDSKKCRVIMDLSWPKEGRESVNSHINKHKYRGKSVKCELPSAKIW